MCCFHTPFNLITYPGLGWICFSIKDHMCHLDDMTGSWRTRRLVPDKRQIIAKLKNFIRHKKRKQRKEDRSESKVREKRTEKEKTFWHGCYLEKHQRPCIVIDKTSIGVDFYICPLCPHDSGLDPIIVLGSSLLEESFRMTEIFV